MYIELNTKEQTCIISLHSFDEDVEYAKDIAMQILHIVGLNVTAEVKIYNRFDDLIYHLPHGS